MNMEAAEIESQEQQSTAADSSSDDLRSALQAATREVNERTRDDQGRFAKQEEKQPEQQIAEPKAAEAPQEAAQVAAKASEGGNEPAEQIQSVAHKAPDAWSPAAKAKFAELPVDIQAEIARRETEVHKGFTKFDEQRNVGKAFSDAITPYLPMIRAENADPVAAVQNLLQTAYVLRTAPQESKQAMFVQLASQFGIDLNGMYQRLANGQQQQLPPQVMQLQQQVQELQQRHAQGAQQAEQQAEAQRQAEIQSFAADPKNTYFADVRADMAALLANGRAEGLKEAYDMACWARPEIRSLMLQQSEQQKQAEMKAKAEKAKAAGVSVTGSPAGASSGVGTPNPNASLADDIRAAMRDAMGRL